MSFATVTGQVRRAFGLRVRRAKKLEHFHVVPPDLRLADPTMSLELASGDLNLAAGLHRFGARGLLGVLPANDALARELYGFGWLRHLAAARTELAEQQMRGLLLDWAAMRHAMPTAASAIDVRARRVLSMLAHADAGLAGADAHAFDAILGMIADEVDELAAALPTGPWSRPVLTGTLALVAFELCQPDAAADRCAVLEARLVEGLARLVGADGSLPSRNPGDTLELALDLIPVRRLYVTRHLDVPAAISDALGRMRDFLVFMQHGDQQLGRFGGMGPTSLAELATALKLMEPAAKDDGATRPRIAAPSGFVRLTGGRGVLLFDGGRLTAPSPMAADDVGEAGALSFEFSHGATNLIVNAGGVGYRGAAPASGSAHSRLVIAGMSRGPDVLDGAGRASLGAATDGGGRLSATQFLRVGDSVLTHTRTLTLASDGAMLDGSDLIDGSIGDALVEVQFILHPALHVETHSDRHSLRLTAPDGTAWWFASTDAVPAVGCAMFHAASSGPRGTVKIVLAQRGPAARVTRWSLRRFDRVH